jgi:hypothetical protein
MNREQETAMYDQPDDTTLELSEAEAVQVAAVGLDKPELSVTDFTPDQIEEAIAEAFKARDVPLSVSLLHALAVVDPRRAALIIETINIMSGMRS